MSRGNPEMQPGGWLGAGGWRPGASQGPRAGSRGRGLGVGAGDWLGAGDGDWGWGWGGCGGLGAGAGRAGLGAGGWDTAATHPATHTNASRTLANAS